MDRSLGCVRVPQLLRADGWDIITLAEHYGVPADESVQDVEWLSLAGDRGWAALMKDDRIRYRTVEREALIGAGVTAFCLSSGNLATAAMAELFMAHKDEIWQRATDSGSSFYVISKSGMRRIDL